MKPTIHSAHRLEARLPNLLVRSTCPFCGTEGEVLVNNEDLNDWQNGVLIQKALPYLSVGERELLKTGICNPCWKQSFGEEA